MRSAMGTGKDAASAAAAVARQRKCLEDTLMSGKCVPSKLDVL